MRAQAHQWSNGELVLGAIACAVVWLFLYAILRAFERKKPEEMQADIVAESLRVVSTPMQLPGGRWGMYKTELVECAAPMKQGELVVHDKSNPSHVANCAECREGRKFRGSGVSFRSN